MKEANLSPESLPNPLEEYVLTVGQFKEMEDFFYSVVLRRREFDPLSGRDYHFIQESTLINVISKEAQSEGQPYKGVELVGSGLIIGNLIDVANIERFKEDLVARGLIEPQHAAMLDTETEKMFHISRLREPDDYQWQLEIHLDNLRKSTERLVEQGDPSVEGVRLFVLSAYWGNSQPQKRNFIKQQIKDDFVLENSRPN